MTEYDHITLYIPPARPIQDVISQLKMEQIQMQDVFPRRRKLLLVGMLQEIIHMLSGRADASEHGLAIFTSPDGFRLFELEKPIAMSMYRCDDHFFEEPMKK